MCDQQVADLLPDEIAGAFRALCGMMLIQTAVAFRTRVRRKEDALHRLTAQRWLADPNRGVISFAECCDVMNVTQTEARTGFGRIADGRLDSSIKRVYGGKSRAYDFNESVGSGQ